MLGVEFKALELLDRSIMLGLGFRVSEFLGRSIMLALGFSVLEFLDRSIMPGYNPFNKLDIIHGTFMLEIGHSI